MAEILIGLLILIGVAVVLVIATVVATQVALSRRNQVVAGVRSPTPNSWLVSGRREAVLHRRLRFAGRRLELVPSGEGLADVINRLRVELVELDGYLLTVARRPAPARRADRRIVGERIAMIEDLIRRVEERARRQPVSLDELSERLDALEAADEELRGLEPG